MAAKHPSYFYPELTDQRLAEVAEELLDERFETVASMNSPWDDAYTRESAVFGRCRNRLMGLCEKKDWLSVSHAGMDVTFTIQNKVPFRFFRDDPNAPRKPGFFRLNQTDGLFPVDELTPVMWRFVIERAMTEEDEDKVFFIGYNELQEQVSIWEHTPSISALYASDNQIPASKQLEPAFVSPREKEDGEQTEKSHLSSEVNEPGRKQQLE
ncbi:hypothetical protein [Marinobacter sp.]|uniref:hypothetical protein n=1 Tax=Marinobacter sp. TaxID=50741 RepID=UPI000C8AA561|nr:hypothetical protein [Marinobacter sp.]MAB50249.1 hypothetical protein [Marinobacter sp.]|tara:strand:+ start:112 stop:744 length:633 start_codon:yes stop_codon:yes gene_type:complete